MKNISITRTENRENTQAVIVQDAYLGEHGPISGCFEVFDVDDSIVYEDGFAHITVMCSIAVQATDDTEIKLKVPAASVMGVVGHSGDVITEVRL